MISTIEMVDFIKDNSPKIYQEIYKRGYADGSLSVTEEIVKNNPSEYYYGCNTNGEHEKCEFCGYGPRCNIRNKILFKRPVRK